MEHLHACCVCKNACRIEGSRFHCLGRRGKPKTTGKNWAELQSASICLGLTFLYPIFEAASRVKAESAIVCRSSIARSPYREFSLWLRHQLTFLSVSVHSRTLTNSHIGYVPDPFPSVTQRIKWPADGWGLVYETSNCVFLFGAPLLFSEIGFCMSSCSYISVKMATPWGSLTLLSFHSLCLHLRSHLTKWEVFRNTSS